MLLQHFIYCYADSWICEFFLCQAERMQRQMMMDMPLRSLVNYGVMDDDGLDGLIAMLNA